MEMVRGRCDFHPARLYDRGWFILKTQTTGFSAREHQPPPELFRQAGARHGDSCRNRRPSQSRGDLAGSAGRSAGALGGSLRDLPANEREWKYADGKTDVSAGSRYAPTRHAADERRYAVLHHREWREADRHAGLGRSRPGRNRFVEAGTVHPPSSRSLRARN